MYSDRPRRVGRFSQLSSCRSRGLAGLLLARVMSLLFFGGGVYRLQRSPGVREHTTQPERKDGDAVSEARSLNVANFLLDFIHSGERRRFFRSKQIFFTLS